MIKKILFCCLCCVAISIAGHAAVRPDHISEEMWEAIEPYLLPDNHPARVKLEHVLRRPDTLESERTMKKAGFDLSKSQRQRNHVKVAKHEKLKGYLIKTYTDDQEGFEDWPNFIARAKAAKRLRAAINEYGYGHIFKAPHKWIYILPYERVDNQRKCVLVVEDMRVYDDARNYDLWKKTKRMTRERLLALYTLISKEGLIDSVYIDNVPFSIDGKNAFIDTEHIYAWPVPYHKLTSYLNNSVKDYWIDLTK